MDKWTARWMAEGGEDDLEVGGGDDGRILSVGGIGSGLCYLEESS